MRNITKFLMLVVLCLVGMQGNAQNVTVRPDNGSMIATRKTGGGDTFFNWGGFSTWKHNQLALTMTTGDSDNNLTNSSNQLTASGQLANHANDIFATGGTGTKYIQLGKGRDMNTYLTIALPKGYRITGYTITFHRISQPNGASGTIYNYDRYVSFGETNNSFTYRTTTNSTTQNLTSYRGLIPQNDATQYTISRTSQTETDMGNVLYFKLGTQNRNGTATTVDYRAFIQFDHIEFYFTAEADYAPVTPTTSVTNRSAVDISFTTSKMNYGTLTSQTDGGSARISYNGTISDLNANLTLYEDGSVTSVSDNGFDGIGGNVVDYKAGSISSAGNFFKLESSKHGNLTGEGEAIYYIETPIWVTSGTGTNAHRDPIGYRIVGATFDYAAGTDHTYYPATFKIEIETTGHGPDEDGLYAMNYYNGRYTWDPKFHTVWRIDEDGYIFYGTSSLMYYLAVGTDGAINVVTEKPTADAGTFEVVDNQIRRKNHIEEYFGWNEVVNMINVDGTLVEETYVDEDGKTWTRVTRYPVIVTSENNRATYNELTPAGGGTTGRYTLRIYDPTGTKVIAEKVVEGTGGSIDVSEYTDIPYNNDAIKIGILGTGLINGHLTLQALDPYIDHIDIVCQEYGTSNGGKLTQQFNATDFSVRGGKFTFYVPEDFTFPAQFTFENLYSKYGDETYYNETSSNNHARYYFLGSTYSGYENNDVYARYNNTAHRDADYTTKVACLQPGNIPYTFNNAATVGTSGGNYVENPFSVDLYEDAGGVFQNFIFYQNEMTAGTTKTAYLFTCDETRYNIAPTTAIQHVYYAYYEMTIDMKKQTYTPQLAWEKVYNETFYGDNKTDAMFGLKITTTPVTDDQGTHSGYVTVSQIKDYINGRAASGTQGQPGYVEEIPTALTGGDNAPSSLSQILYIDGSNLMNIVENQKNNVTHQLSELKTGLATNALIYLPYGSSNHDDNFAYNTIAQYAQTPIFRAANNIVLTDKNPFYSKYDILVDAAKYAKYSRQITTDDYGKVNNATLILPFEINLTNGVHTNETTDACSFSLNTMVNGQTITQNTQSPSYVIPNVQFSSIGGESSEANKPYVVEVKTAASGSDNSNYSFVATQYGATIVKTPTQSATSTLGQQFYIGETAGGTYKYTGIKDGKPYTVTYTNTAQGNYSGVKYDREATNGENVFYFAANQFINLHTLKADERYLLVYPFRSVYTYTGGATGEGQLNYFNVIFEEENGETDAIAEMPKHVDLAVRSGKGYLSMTSAIDQTVNVRSLNGMSVGELNMRAGDSQSINLPAGIYLVNNVKIIVK